MPYGPDLSEGQLRWMARARIGDGRLPRILLHSFSPKYGSDEMCQLCDRRIGRYRVGYHVTDPRYGDALAFHLVCYKLWQLECCGVSSGQPLMRLA